MSNEFKVGLIVVLLMTIGLGSCISMVRYDSRMRCIALTSRPDVCR